MSKEYRLAKLAAYEAIGDYLNTYEFQKLHKVIDIMVYENGDFGCQIEERKRGPRKSRAKDKVIPLDELDALDHAIETHPHEQ
jgi:hypothetical protein